MAGISSSDLECLDFLNLEGRVTAGRLAEVTGLTTGAITGVVDRLEKAGSCAASGTKTTGARSSSPSCRRRLTKIGQLYEPMQQAMTKVWSGYSDEELNLLLRFATEGYKGVLEATEALEGMLDTPPEKRADLRRLAGVLGADRGGWTCRRCAAANMPHIAPSIIQKCRQWSVSMMKLSPTVPRKAEKIGEISALPGHADEDVPEAQDDGGEDQRGIADAGEPAARHEGVEIGVVGVFGKVVVELQGADAERQVERHLGAEDVAAEPAEAAFVIALVEARALLEHLGDGIE